MKELISNLVTQLDINDIVSSVLGAFIGGLFTVLGVYITIRYEKNKEKRKEIKDELQRQKEKEEQIHKDKPRLEIIDYKKLCEYSFHRDIDASLILCEIQDYKNKGRAEFYYDKSITKPENWVCVEYVFRNTGNTEIDHIYFSTNLPKNTALFNVLNGENEICYENCFLNYTVILEKTIKPQETLSVKMNYVKEQVIAPYISAPITIWLIDVNGNWWEQPLFAPTNKIYNSTRTSHKSWKDNTSIETAIKCFDNPSLW